MTGSWKDRLQNFTVGEITSQNSAAPTMQTDLQVNLLFQRDFMEQSGCQLVKDFKTFTSYSNYFF